MIRQVDSSKINTNQQPQSKAPNFKGLESVGGAVLTGIQYLESQPMVNVAAVDLSTAIIPRTVVEAQTNPYAGMEAFRRESSGLIINCMIPGVIVAGLAAALQRPIMGKNSNMSKCWANEDTIKMFTDEWGKASEFAVDECGNKLFANDTKRAFKSKVYNTLQSVINKSSSIDGHNKVQLNPYKVDDSLIKIADNIAGEAYTKQDQKAVNKALGNIIDKFHVARHFEFDGVKHSQLFREVIQNSPFIFRELDKGSASGKTAAEFAKEFAGKATKLVKFKSLMGLGIIIPLALAAQPINRWLTAKTSGTKGAPIYNDFAKIKTKELNLKEKASLTTQKIISVSAMLLVALASIGKKPNKAMIKNISQFSDIFPTMDQARIISAATFSSRMMSSEDKNDLREATVRDIATFSAFYFLGDYVAKGFATLLEKSSICKDKGIILINRLKDKPKDVNIFSRLLHWAKDTSLKSTEEVYSSTNPAKFNKTAKNLRAACQIANIGFSLIALGLIIPIWNRHQTKKKHEAELAKLKAENAV